MNNTRIITLALFAICFLIIAFIFISRSTDEYYYGSSFRQNKLVNTIRLHKYGITGKGVNIGIVDAGFYKDHSAFKKTRIINEYDFARKLTSTMDPDHLGGVDHGTNVLSMMGAYKKNELIGIAYDANFLLAKTDINASRLKQEEVNAVNASQWLFESGAQIITTSLSFNKFDDAGYYYPSQMNGRISLITKTADSLVDKGVIYLASAGNNFDNEWRIIECPADGFGVIAVGSVNKNRRHSFFSSCGPSADGRIKPDIVTPGEGVWNANYLPGIKPEFSWNHGTSLSAPIAAGIAALILSAHPELNNHQVIEAIKHSASKHYNPDNIIGWGLPDAEKAVTYFGPAFSNVPEIISASDNVEINTYVFSYYGLDRSSVKLHVIKNGLEQIVFNMKEEDENYFSVALPKEKTGSRFKFYFTAKDVKGQLTKFPSGFLGEHFNYMNNK
jgi:subtilisin family serine protease